MLGLIRGTTILKAWRWVVVLVAVIAALTAPGSDIMMMFVLMAPLLIFFFAAIGICMINDKRRDRKLAKAGAGFGRSKPEHRNQRRRPGEDGLLRGREDFLN